MQYRVGYGFDYETIDTPPAMAMIHTRGSASFTGIDYLSGLSLNCGRYTLEYMTPNGDHRCRIGTNVDHTETAPSPQLAWGLDRKYPKVTSLYSGLCLRSKRYDQELLREDSRCERLNSLPDRNNGVALHHFGHDTSKTRSE